MKKKKKKTKAMSYNVQSEARWHRQYLSMTRQSLLFPTVWTLSTVTLTRDHGGSWDHNLI